jgi:tRNA-specific 2-thiouridylase
MRYELRRGRDPRKDQSYFLFSLNQEQLGRTMFPLGELTKEQVRAIAREMGLKTCGKQESQEVCFVPENDYRRFLREEAGVVEKTGDIVTRDGKVVGRHGGIHNFTIGQREGLNLGGLKRPLYVVALDAAANRVIVGTSDELMRREFEVGNCVWHGDGECGRETFSREASAANEIRGYNTTTECSVKVRRTAEPAPATVVIPSSSRNPCRVRMREPQRAVTPGQAAVFYQDDVVIGGGWIC